MALIGRDAELGRIAGDLRRTGGVLVCGPAGVGKSALIAEAAARLPHPPVARAVATTAGRSVPLGALAPLLPPDAGSGSPALVAGQVAAVLAARHGGHAATAGPVVLVDDVQELDGPSAAVLLALVVGGSVRLLGTLRNGGAPCDAVTALWKEGLTARIDLAPFTHEQTAAVLADLLGGPVASVGVTTVHELTAGNALHLTELARYGRERGFFVRHGGVWWWRGGRHVPPRLGEMLLARVDALSPSARDAVDVLALGEPLPFDTLVAVSGQAAVEELDRSGLVTGDTRDGVLLLRFAHPLLQVVTEERLTPTRRRVLGARLRSVPAEGVDVVRRAVWQLAAGGAPDTGLLLAGAEALMTTDPGTAERMARRATAAGAVVPGLVVLSHLQAERGDAEAAHATLCEAADGVGSDDERLEVHREDLSQSLWTRRDPAAAQAAVDRMAATLPAAYRDEVGSSRALTFLFTGRTSRAAHMAGQVLARAPDGGGARIRALTALLGAACFADRGAEALSAAARLERELPRAELPATRLGLIEALLAIARLLHDRPGVAPRPSGTFGRWPARPVEPAVDGVAGWPLLVGMRELFAGRPGHAVVPLREALFQQEAGEGVFRSEAAAALVVGLCALGRPDEAEEVLATTPPDAVALVPGLGGWAAAAVAAAYGRRAVAADLAVGAAREAAAAGAAVAVWVYLADAARWGDPSRAAATVDEIAVAPGSAVCRALAVGVRSRSGGSAEELAGAARQALTAGLHRHAVELAVLARDAGPQRPVARAAAAVLSEAQARLGDTASAQARALRLTARESEVAHLAAAGRSDRQIAELLGLSVRTVQSHLAAAYRKLGVGSRTELAGSALR